MEEIKQLLDEAIENLKDNDHVELHLTLEAALNKVSNIVYGSEDEAEEKIEFLKEEFNPVTIKEHFISRLLECEGVTKLKVEGEIKFQFDKPRIFLIIE